jgi:phage tail-like protein
MVKYGITYDLLPPLYKKEDSNIRPVPFPLQRFLQVAGTGFDYLEEKAEGHSNLYDLDRTPAELLPHLAQMMGFDFPYEMSEFEQRSFLKVLPTLYKFKGTARVFDYLGQVIFGQFTRVESTYRLNIDPEEAYKHVIDVYVQVTGSTADITSRADRYRKFAENFRPLNTVLNPVVQLFYTDIYEILANADADVGLIRHFESDVYDQSKLVDLDGIIRLRNIELESYNNSNFNDSSEAMVMKALNESDAYVATKLIPPRLRTLHRSKT